MDLMSASLVTNTTNSVSLLGFKWVYIGSAEHEQMSTISIGCQGYHPCRVFSLVKNEVLTPSFSQAHENEFLKTEEDY